MAAVRRRCQVTWQLTSSPRGLVFAESRRRGDVIYKPWAIFAAPGMEPRTGTGQSLFTLGLVKPCRSSRPCPWSDRSPTHAQTPVPRGQLQRCLSVSMDHTLYFGTRISSSWMLSHSASKPSLYFNFVMASSLGPNSRDPCRELPVLVIASHKTSFRRPHEGVHMTASSPRTRCCSLITNRAPNVPGSQNLASTNGSRTATGIHCVPVHM